MSIIHICKPKRNHSHYGCCAVESEDWDGLLNSSERPSSARFFPCTFRRMYLTNSLALWSLFSRDLLISCYAEDGTGQLQHTPWCTDMQSINTSVQHWQCAEAILCGLFREVQHHANTLGELSADFYRRNLQNQLLVNWKHKRIVGLSSDQLFVTPFSSTHEWTHHYSSYLSATLKPLVVKFWCNRSPPHSHREGNSFESLSCIKDFENIFFFVQIDINRKPRRWFLLNQHSPFVLREIFYSLWNSVIVQNNS